MNVSGSSAMNALYALFQANSASSTGADASTSGADASGPDPADLAGSAALPPPLPSANAASQFAGDTLAALTSTQSSAASGSNGADGVMGASSPPPAGAGGDAGAMGGADGSASTSTATTSSQTLSESALLSSLQNLFAQFASSQYGQLDQLLGAGGSSASSVTA